MAQKKFTIDGGFETKADSIINGTLDMGNNQIINVTSPTTALGVANKGYVDQIIANSVDLTGYATETYVDTAETNSIATASADATTKADAAQAAAETYTDGRETAITSAYQAYADTAETDAIATASADATAKANSAEADAIASAEAKDVARALTASNDRAAIRSEFAAADTTLQSNIDTEKGRIDVIMSASTSDADTFAEIVSLVNSVDTTNDNGLAAEITARTNADTALSGRLDTVEGSGTGSVAKALVDAKAYADQAEADAIASAEAKDVVRAAAANAYADQAEVDAKAYTDTRETAITTAYEAYADQAEADAIATASADATTKANAAQAVADSALPKTGGTMTGTVVVKGVNETVKVITGAAPVILPSDGTIQTWTLSGASTPTFSGSWASGEAITLMVSAGASGSVTWPTMQWAGGTAPTLSTSGYTVMTLWKVGTTFYGTSGGDMS